MPFANHSVCCCGDHAATLLSTGPALVLHVARCEKGTLMNDHDINIICGKIYIFLYPGNNKNSKFT